jgi:CRISPR-associated endonuclease/helicase Cas3
LVWRADIDPAFSESAYQLMQLMPPRAAEAIELPVWAVRRWLSQSRSGISDLADIPVPEPDPYQAPEANRNSQQQNHEHKVFRWTGDMDSSAWIQSNQIRSGDTVVVPATYGGVDEYGWNPDARKAARDVAAEAARPYAGRRFAVRVAPGLLDDPANTAALAQAIAVTGARHWKILRAAVKSIGLPQQILDDLDGLDDARGSGRSNVDCYIDAYGEENDCPRGVVFLAPRGIKRDDRQELAATNATEDDITGSLPGSNLELLLHCQQAEKRSEQFAAQAGLSQERIQDLKLAAHLHDAGKADPRFQAWLALGDSLGPDSEHLLAKSARPLPRNPRECSGLPLLWRHEALSVRLAPHIPRFREARDPELVLWLVGTHHGYGRPFFPHSDVEDARERINLPDMLGIPHNTLEAGAGPQSLAFDWKGLDWPGLYKCLKARYGVWELARLEAILRLADDRASEQARVEGAADAEKGAAQ